ncbi:hypothetical protein METH109765_23225 [Mesobacillus thioparans]|jgi:hypothetical protein
MIDFKKATLNQLMQILRFEQCELSYKCFAESEIERRAKESETPINYHV